MCTFLKVKCFLALQHGEDDFCYAFLIIAQFVIDCCSACQAIRYLIVSDISKHRVVHPCYGDLRVFEFGNPFLAHILAFNSPEQTLQDSGYTTGLI